MAQMPVDIRDVAALAGVSVGSVSNVLNRPERVSAPTRKRIEEAIVKLGYVRNGAARNLRAGSSRTLALTVFDLSNPFFADVARGAEDVALDAGYGMLLSNSRHSPARERSQLRMFEEYRVDAILLSPVDQSNLDEVRRMRQRGTSVIFLETTVPSHCSVSIDDVIGGRLAGAHLFGAGHRVVGFVGTPDRLHQCRDRRRGLVDAAEIAGLNPIRAVVDIEAATMSSHAGFDAVNSAIASDLPMTGIFCANDLLALGALRALIASGRRVPDDMALMGYDDIEFAGQSAIPLTSINQPSYELGRSAAELAISEINATSDHHHEEVRFIPTLVPRASTNVANAPVRRPSTRRR